MNPYKSSFIITLLAILTNVVTLSTSFALEKVKPAGIYCLMSGDRVDAQARDLNSLKFWDISYLDGLRLRTFWDKIESRSKDYDWSYIDEALRLAERSGKSISFSIGAGMSTPDWVYDKGVEKFPFTPPRNPNNGRSPGQMVMPLPWDERFIEEWGAFIQATAERYDDNPHLAYIVMAGFGPLIETYLVKFPEDMRRIESLGGMKKWVSAAKRIIDMYAKSFTSTPFILAMGEPIRASEGREALKEVVEYGLEKYPGRFGVMHCALGAENSPRTAYKDEIIRSASSNNPVGLQFVWSTTGRNSDWVGGSLAEVLDHAINIKAHFVEVYAADCENSIYSTDLSKAGRSLKQN